MNKYLVMILLGLSLFSVGSYADHIGHESDLKVVGGSYLIMAPMGLGAVIGTATFNDGYKAPVICSIVSLLGFVGAGECAYNGPVDEEHMKYATAIKEDNVIAEVGFFGFIAWAKAFSQDCFFTAMLGIGAMFC